MPTDAKRSTAQPAELKQPARRKQSDAYHHGDLRKALIEATLLALEQGGAGSVSLAATAKALGVSQPAPYRHFQDRDALLGAVAAEGFRRFSQDLMKAASSPSKLSGLERMCRAYVDFGLAQPGLYELMFASDLLSRASASDDLKVAGQGSFKLLMGALAPDLDAAGRLRRATRIWVGLHGTVMLMSRGLLHGRPAEVDVDQLIHDIIA